MRTAWLIVLLVSAVCAIQGATIDLGTYENSAKYDFAEETYNVGKHTYRLINISPQTGNDTSCIAVIGIDKRKYVLLDMNVSSHPYGLVVPEDQPIKDGLVILKPSPFDGKTFLVLPTGKLLTLPGANTLFDVPGNTAYCVWDNDGVYRLTVFDYNALRILIKSIVIPQPLQWYSDGLSYGFAAKEDGEKVYYAVEPITKSATKVDGPPSGGEKKQYLVDFSEMDTGKCCGAEVLRKQ